MADNWGPETTELEVRDTRDIADGNPFDFFRHAIISSGLPFTLEVSDEVTFAAKVERIDFETGKIQRITSVPHIANRTARNIANSSEEAYITNFILSGELAVEQGDAREIARPGDFVILDCSRPGRMLYPDGSRGHQSLSLVVPKHDFAEVKGAQEEFGNLVLRREQLLAPLSMCLSFISDNLLVSSRNELAALYWACLPLICFNAGRVTSEQRNKHSALRSEYLFAEILDYVHRHLDNADLSPMHVAVKFGISDRYLHKLFAASGGSFGSYISHKRLLKIAEELASPKGRFEPIASLAYRWGFGDISTFNKLFKRKFGCSPKVFRARSNY